MVLAVVLAGGLATLASCRPANTGAVDESAADTSEVAAGMRAGLPRDSQTQSGEETKGGETYAQYDKRRDALEISQGTFEGYGCTQDCIGHRAGFDWAARRGVTDPDKCGGKSWSFEEGCRSYAEEQPLDGPSQTEK